MKLKIAILLLFFSVIIISCAKKPELSCNGDVVQASLLGEEGKINSSTPKYFTKQLSNFKVVNKNTTQLICQVNLTLTSTINTANKIVLPTKYSVSSPDNRSINVALIGNTLANQQYQTKWLKALNQQTKNIGDYQLTPYGALYVMQTDALNQELYFNGTPVSPLVNNYQVNIENSYKLGNAYVFLIGNYTGGTIDNDTPNNLLVQVTNNSQVTVSKPFAYQQDGITQDGSKLVINGIALDQPYAESTDFPIYIFESGVLTTIKATKSAAYYQAKFAKWQAIDIINQARADDCFDVDQKVLDMSHACGYAAKYCFEFKAMQNPQHDANYKILSDACTN